MFWLLKLFAEESVASAFRLKVNFEVNTIINDDVKLVLEFLNFISVTADIDYFLFIGFEDTVSLDYFPDRFFIFGEGGVLSIDLRLILDSDLLVLIF